MIRLVAATLAIYLGALVAAFSYLPVETKAGTCCGQRHGRADAGVPAASGTRRTIRPGVVSDSRTPGTFNATYR
jgi:hypothetical protein